MRQARQADALDTDTPDVLLSLLLRFPLNLGLSTSNIEDGLAVPRELDLFFDLAFRKTLRRPLPCPLLELFRCQWRATLDFAVDVIAAEFPVFSLVKSAQAVVLDLEG